MKEAELRELAECVVCNRKLGETGLPLFWVLKLERHGLKLDVVQRQQGLTMVLGGNAFLAQHMGPDEEMTERIGDELKVMVCEPCSHEQSAIMAALARD